jgi:hypothetical protein
MFALARMGGSKREPAARMGHRTRLESETRAVAALYELSFAVQGFGFR